MNEQEIRQVLIKEAREWRGTKWLHHQSCKGAGTDCVGFTTGVARAAGIQFTEHENYHRIPNKQAMLEAFQERFLQIDPGDRQPGDVGLVKFSGIPHHTVIFTDLGIIHASLSERCVVEHSLDDWWLDRIVAVFNPLKTPTGESTLKIQ